MKNPQEPGTWDSRGFDWWSRVFGSFKFIPVHIETINRDSATLTGEPVVSGPMTCENHVKTGTVIGGGERRGGDGRPAAASLVS